MFMPLLRWFVRGFEEQSKTVEVQGELERRGKNWVEEKVDRRRI
jgi:hypothetical protein